MSAQPKIKLRILTKSHGIVQLEVAPAIDVQQLEKDLTEKYGQFIQL